MTGTAFHSADGNVRYSDYIIYADESGDPNPASVDANYPVFVLNFCIFRKDIYATSALPAMTEFKFQHFGHDMVVLHERDIRRRLLPFALLHNEYSRNVFMQGLNRIMAEMDFAIIATLIDKRKLTDERNIYLSAFRLCLRQSHEYLGSRGQSGRITHIVLESRGSREDRELAREIQDAQTNTNRLNEPLDGFEVEFADKKTNSVGLQIADLTARPIGVHWINPGQSNRAWELLQPKLFRTPLVWPDTAHTTVGR